MKKIQSRRLKTPKRKSGVNTIQIRIFSFQGTRSLFFKSLTTGPQVCETLLLNFQKRRASHVEKFQNF